MPNGRPEFRRVMLAPVLKGPNAWPQERWSEVVDWLDARGFGTILVSKEAYTHTAGKPGMHLLNKQVTFQDVVNLASHNVPCMVSDGSRWMGANLPLIEVAREDTVGKVVDEIADYLAIDPLPEPSISACLMVKNEMQLLPRTIDLLERCADQIVVVDTGSTDGTREWLAGRGSVTLLDMDVGNEIDSFSEVRNHGISHATGRYVMWLDAPERLKDPEKLRKVVLLDNADAWMMKSTFETGGHLVREKIVLRPFAKFVDRVHEFIQVGGLKVATLASELGTARAHSVKVGREGSFARNVRLVKKMLEESSEDHPRRGRWLFYLAMEHFQEGKFDEALPLLYKRLENAGWEEEIFGALVALTQILLYHTKEYHKATEAAYLMRGLKPKCREWTYAMAEAMRLQGKQYAADNWYRQTAENVEFDSAVWAWGDAHSNKLFEHACLASEG